MTLRRQRSRYQQLAEFERGKILRAKKKVDFLSMISQKDLVEMNPLCMIFGSSDPGKKTMVQPTKGHY
ncbi:hypothetical protein TNCV_3473081 [Trichonephila clavipes]|nr:hypothetical protein TNCV_3473081 [Trichonephila clavipes]